jgi:hypothetical protein
MVSIFFDMIEEIMEVFMDDFSVYGKTLMIVSKTWIRFCKDVKKST